MRKVGSTLPAKAGSAKEVTPELKKELEALAKDPGEWYEITAAEGESRPEIEKIHRIRWKTTQVLKANGITGYEYKVKNGALYGRYAIEGNGRG